MGSQESDMTEWFHFHFSLSCIGEGNGNPLQYSCLENPRDRRAWWAAIYGVTQSQTRLKWLSSSSRTPIAWMKIIHIREGNLLIQSIDANVNLIWKYPHRHTQNWPNIWQPQAQSIWHLKLTNIAGSLGPPQPRPQWTLLKWSCPNQA